MVPLYITLCGVGLVVDKGPKTVCRVMSPRKLVTTRHNYSTRPLTSYSCLPGTLDQSPLLLQLHLSQRKLLLLLLLLAPSQPHMALLPSFVPPHSCCCSRCHCAAAVEFLRVVVVACGCCCRPLWQLQCEPEDGNDDGRAVRQLPFLKRKIRG